MRLQFGISRIGFALLLRNFIYLKKITTPTPPPPPRPVKVRKIATSYYKIIKWQFATVLKSTNKHFTLIKISVRLLIFK